MCLDTQRLYYDETDNRRVAYGYTGVNTMNDLMYYITPSYGTTYYCWEDNSLWLWNNKWVALYTDVSYPSAYVYDDNKNITDVYNGNQPYTVLDNNGLLKDGSVVIRDANRIIKGKIYIEPSNDNMTISSFLGGGIRLLPNGKMNEDGEFLIGDKGKSYLRSEYHNKNNQMFVDYSEVPDLDPSEYPKESHIYEVFHEGNLDVSAIKVITPQDIYAKLQDPSLPNVLDLSVRKINGKTIDEISVKGHTHVANDISDFNTTARAQALVQVNDVFTRMTAEGITVSYQPVSSSFRMTVNPFTLSFNGGVSGSGLITKLSDTTINLDVDPNKHIHQNYIDRMDLLQDEINAISSVNPENYYNKSQVDNKISVITPTDVPTRGYALKVNNDLVIPGTSLNTKALVDSIEIKLQGDITGNVTTDLSNNVTINTSSSNILSDTPVEGKALKVNSQLNLPANAISASKLNHNLSLIFTGEVTGSGNIDTEKNQSTINLTLDPSSNILQVTDLGIRVASLGSDGKINPSQLPASQVGLVPVGNWNPSTGAPSNNPIEGQFWITDTEGTFNNKLYQVDDWCLYYNSEWKKIDTNDNVISVNGKSGIITLNASDLNALSTDYINYSLGNTIPQNKIVMTSDDGIIEGASVSKLSREFNLSSTNGDIEIDTNSSASTSTDGSNNLNITMNITEEGYNNIFDKTSYIIQNHGSNLDYKHKINFGSGIDIETSDDSINISATSNIPIEIIRYKDDMTEEELDNFKNILQSYLSNRSEKPIYIFAERSKNNIHEEREYNRFNIYVIDDNYEDPTNNSFEWKIWGIPNEVKLESKYTPTQTINQNTYALIINGTYTDNQFTITQVVEEINNLMEPISFLSTNYYTEGSYTPTQDYHPATKKYVDEKAIPIRYTTANIGNGIDDTFIIDHNLNTENIIVQFRNATTGDELLLSNRIINDKSIEVKTEEIYEMNDIKVIILAL